MTTAPSSRWLKSTDWLAAHLRDPNIVAVDGSYYLSTQNRNARAEYLAAHIPGAVFFDINKIADTSIDLPHMLPGPDQFPEWRTSRPFRSIRHGRSKFGVPRSRGRLAQRPGKSRSAILTSSI